MLNIFDILTYIIIAMVMIDMVIEMRGETK